MATKRASAAKARKPAKRPASARARKPAGLTAARRKPAAAARPRFIDLSFTAMLAEIFGMRMEKEPPARRNMR